MKGSSLLLSALGASALVLYTPTDSAPTRTAAGNLVIPTIHTDTPALIDPSAETYQFFKQADFHPSYDPRIASAPLPYSEQKEAVRVLIQTCLATLSDLSVEAWLMHGSLLGWWWGQRVLPWDSDADIHISENSLNFLAAYYNMTLFFYQYASIPAGRRFRLEINPHSSLSKPDPLNTVDARWTDLQTGLYVDISALRYQRDAAGAPTHMLAVKSSEKYAESEIFPLRETMFEGVNALIPYAFKEVLAHRYGDKAMTETDYNDHVFDEKAMQWQPKKTLKEPAEL